MFVTYALIVDTDKAQAFYVSLEADREATIKIFLFPRFKVIAIRPARTFEVDRESSG